MRFLKLLFIALILSAFHVSAQSDLIGRWNFEEGSGTTTADLSGNNHDGTIMGTAAFSTDAAIDNGSVFMNRGNGNYVDFGSIDLGDSFTVSLWAKVLTGSSNIQCIFSNCVSGTSSDGIAIYINEYGTTDKSILVYAGDGTTYEKGASNLNVITYDAWNHVAVTVNKTAGTIAIYVNGVDVTSDGTIHTPFKTNGGCVAGAYSGGNWVINGGIDDVRLYSKELTADEVDALYAANTPEDPMLAHWDFNEGTGTTAADLSDNNYDLTLSQATWVDGVDGSAMSVTNAGYASIEDALLGSSFPCVSTSTSTENMSVSAWINLASTSGRQPVVVKEAQDQRGFVFSVTDGYLALQIYNVSGTKTYVQSNNTLLETGSWHHIAATYEYVTDGTSIVKLYLDGQEEFSASEVLGPIKPSDAPLVIGAYLYHDAGTYNDYYSGLIDEVQVYSKILSATEISDIYDEYEPIPMGEYNLTIDVVGNGAVVPASGNYSSGEEVPITAVPEYGWHFSGWSGDATGSDLTDTIAMDADKTVTATFIEKTQTLEPVAKLNFTYEPVLDDEPGWTGVYDHESFPLTLSNGILIELDAQDHSIGSGKRGEATTPFPSKVGSTYNYMHSPFLYVLRFIIHGLDASEKYTFEAFSSRDDEEPMNGTEPTLCKYTIEGTGDTLVVDALGNNSQLIRFEHVSVNDTGVVILSLVNTLGINTVINALIVSKELQVMADTIAKINFAADASYDVAGWTSVYDHESFPLTLGGGINVEIDTEEHTIDHGNTGEPLTIFPAKVGTSYNNLHAAFPYTVHFSFEGLDPLKGYSFEAFSSRNHINQWTGEPFDEQRISTFGIEGTTLSANLDAIGNTDKTVKFDNVYPSADGTIIFTWSNNNNYAYLNALIVTQVIGSEESVELNAFPVGGGTVTPSTGEYVVGTEVQLEAIPDAGWEFKQWAGDVSGTDENITVTMNSNLVIGAIFREISEGEDTIAKINFTFDSNYFQDGWSNVEEDTTYFPLALDNGVVVKLNSELHSLGSNVHGEPITLFEPKVGSTYCYMHSAFPYTLHYTFMGLDTDDKYSYTFTAFASRSSAVQTEPSISVFGIEGTSMIEELDAAGNKDQTAKFMGLKPSANGEITFTMTHKPDKSAFINLLILTRSDATAVDDLKLSSEIKFYPSPVSDYLNIEGLPSGSRIMAFDIMGRQVMDIDESGSKRKVDMQNLHSGIYLFLIENNNSVLKSFKVLKK